MLKFKKNHAIITVTITSIILLLAGCNSTNDAKSKSLKETKTDNIEVEDKTAEHLNTGYSTPLNGWIKSENEWFYLDENGSLKTGWVEDNGKWYYCSKLGLEKGWLSVNNNWYYFNEDGEMLTNTVTPDGYTVDSNGVRIQ